MAIDSVSSSLLASVRIGNNAAWERLIALHVPLVLTWVRRAGVQHGDAEDITQAVFLAVFTHLNSFRREKPDDTFRGWLRIITRSKVADHFRRRKRQGQAEGGTEAKLRFEQVADWELSDTFSSAEQDQEDDHQLLRRVLPMVESHFHAHTWRAFCMVVIDGKTPQEVADELGIDIGSVRKAKFRVLRRIRQELEVKECVG